MNSLELMRQGPVIPVIVIDNLAHAVPMARALRAGGVGVLEITLRTPVALEAVEAIAEAFPDLQVGVGTVIEPSQLHAARRAGASFAVSPGLAPGVALEARALDMPLLAGVMTPSEVMQALALGLTELKFFPAEQAGGQRMLSALQGPFGGVRFCPTGGITEQSAPDYLTLPNVACVGGTWLTPRALMAAEDWAAIEGLARHAAKLRRA